MPYIKISPPTGPLNVFYSISTPASHNADAIILGIPTILFLHPEYISQQIFEAQFSDYGLRQFNLVSFDMRSRGETEGVIGDAKFAPAEDAYYFMQALRLPPCHIFALSISCATAGEIARSHPDRVLSITACSSTSPVESESILSGRLEVHEFWAQATLLPGSDQTTDKNHRPKEINKLLLDDAIIGIKQFAFNNEDNPLMSAIVNSAMAQAMHHWTGSAEKTREGFQAAVAWPLERRMPVNEELQSMTCPVDIIYCSEDVAYSLENSQFLVDLLKGLGTKCELHQVRGSHYGCVGGAKEINAILRQVVLSCYDMEKVPTIPVTAEQDHMLMRTPFQEILEKYGYHPSDSSEIDLVF